MIGVSLLETRINQSLCFSSALMMMSSAAEQEYFTQSTNLTWDEARKHCQMCFTDLVTLTPENIQTIAKGLTSEHWVGLRKNLNSSSNSSMFWSHWANGDPLTFQNWYPGWPVLKSSSTKRGSCSCSCPATTSSATFTELATPNATSFSGLVGITTEDVTDVTTFNNFSTEDMTSGLTDTPVPTTAVPTTSMLPSVEPACVLSLDNTGERYIEDSCVVMLSWGAWMEKTCSDPLPFICYEDRFVSKVHVTNVTTRSASLSWQPGPGNISDYRLEVKGHEDLTYNLTNLTYDLVNLMAGTSYSVQVVPVKCDRDLDSQEVVFYTLPNKVENLTISNVTETSVSLSWSNPDGNEVFYLIEVQGRNITSDTEDVEVDGLTPGNPYTFTVLSVVKSNATWSEDSNITAYTKPGKVSDLKVSKSTSDCLLLNWMPPEGSTTGFRVTAVNDSRGVLFNGEVNQTEVNVTQLPMGTKITVSVTALANGTLEGESVTIVSYTAPGPISNLTLITTQDSLNATWSSNGNPEPDGNSSFFTATLQLDGKTVGENKAGVELKTHFGGLKTAANYTVIVYMVNGHLKGPPVQSSKFTLPSLPTHVTVSSFDKDKIALQWRAPANTAAVNYSIRISSSFWGHSWSVTTSETNHTFHNLMSGTNYTFELRTEVDGMSSAPANLSHFTVAEKREISLSMLCSSAESLRCDNDTTRESVIEELRGHFQTLLGDGIFWKLKEQETDN
ncbi:receptor-type tyrosine-protein phosphatase eta [Chaetodon auriga]|uniref:receptor-type tyrosine-protein phosphatase eta n=1 Tax=Chaetodon auriga TaxID=39042 RepID=UPI004032CBA0